MSKVKVLLFGATGMAGHVVYHYLREKGKYKIRNVVFRTKLTEDSIIIDVRDKVEVALVVHKEKPDVIINCIGVLIKGSKEYPDEAIYINAYFPHLLQKLSQNIGAKLIHISTDCVFSGKKGNYTEEDFRDADDIYGRSKALGEIINAKDLTLRTSIIGPELKQNGEGLFHWFMQQKGTIMGYTNAIWGGVTTLELAKAIDISLEKKLTGLIQLSNGSGISKYDLLCLFKEIWKKDNIDIQPFNKIYVDKSIARSTKFNFNIPDYHQMFTEQHDWMCNRRELYNLYF